MNNKRNSVICAILLLAASAHATQQVILSSSTRAYPIGSGRSLEYSKPDFWKDIGSIPSDLGTFTKNSFSKKNLPWLGAITASTLILIEYDQKIYNNTRRAGKKLSISADDKTKTFLKIKGVSVFRGPTDLGSAIYFLGDGWVPLGLCAGMLGYGWAADDWRAAHTGAQLTEGLLATGITTQVLKRISGRETPRAASAPRGVWRLFPSFSDFQGHRTRYDAFPSGHLATGVMAVTVLAENYPEKKLIKPVGYGLMGALAFQMVNNGVHWASDYPLGIAIGYGIGKTIAGRGKKVSGEAPKLTLLPAVMPGGSYGLAAGYRF